MEKVKLILFDWDGVICDSFGIFYSIYTRLYPSEKMTVENFRIYFSELCSKGKPVLPGKLIHYSAEFYKADFFPGIREALVKLNKKGKKIGLISNSPRNIISYLMKVNDIIKLFDFVYTSDHTLRKPNLQLLSEIDLKFGIEEKETIFIGDQVSDLLFVKDKEYTKFFTLYGFSSYDELSQVEKQLDIANVSYYKTSLDLAMALNQIK